MLWCVAVGRGVAAAGTSDTPEKIVLAVAFMLMPPSAGGPQGALLPLFFILAVTLSKMAEAPECAACTVHMITLDENIVVCSAEFVNTSTKINFHDCLCLIGVWQQVCIIIST